MASSNRRRLRQRSPRRLNHHRVRTRCTLQYESTECGAASLSTILNYFGREVPLKELRERCGVDRDGSNARRLLEGARSLGLEARAYRCSGEELRLKGRFPCVIFWGFSHFLVLEGFAGDVVYISDPAQGRIRVGINEFLDRFTGIVLEFEPGPAFKPGGSVASPLQLLPGYLSPFKQSVALLVLIASANCVPAVMLAGLSAEFIDSMLTDGRTYFGIPILWITLLAIICSLLLQSGTSMILRRCEYLLSKGLAGHLFEKLFSAPYNYYQQRLLGEVATRLTLSLELSKTIVSRLLRYVLSLWQAGLILIVCLLISRSLALMLLTVIVANVALSTTLTRLRFDDNRKLALEIGKTLGVGLQGISNVETLKASGLEIDFLSSWQEHFSAVVEQNQRLGRQIAVSTIVANGSSFLLSALIIGVGGLLIMKGDLTLGTLVAFQFLRGHVTTPLTLLPQLNSLLQQLIGTMGRIEDLNTADHDPYVRSLAPLHQDELSSEPSAEILPSSKRLEGRLRLEKVSFGFNSRNPVFIQDIDFHLNSGQHLAIVGSSGSGKSTLIRLIAGLYHPNSGRIFYDDQTWQELPDMILRSCLAYVPQEVAVFNGSIWDNLTLWQEGYSRKEVERAASMACIHDTVIGHPEAYRRCLRDNGADLSGGQRQRLELCRALLRNPSILLLDEATSALDDATEASVLRNIRDAGITTVSVAHRMTAALQSDLVIVLDAGHEVERGSPTSLLKVESHFGALVKAEREESERWMEAL